ncbi:MAG: ribonuclease Y [Deinococcales bacterium]
MTATEIIVGLLGVLIGGGVGLFLGYTRRQQLDKEALAKAEIEVAEMRKQARADAQKLTQEAEETGREQLRRAHLRFEQEQERTRNMFEQDMGRERERFEQEVKRHREDVERDRKHQQQSREELNRDREELKKERERLDQVEDRLNRRAEQQDARAIKLDDLERQLDERSETFKAWEETLKLQQDDIQKQIYEVAQLSREQAVEMILGKLDEELEREKAVRIRTQLEKADLEAKRKATIIISQAIQRSASEVSAAISVSVVPIPSDAMKGRIIGREGRNIRAFEALTGVDLIIDDTPEAVLLSSFNPIRREIAKLALTELVADGRIHPARIEELVHKSQQDMQQYIRDRGDEAALEANIVGLKPGLLQLLGRMHFRTSYGQNVLQHSVQVAHLTAMIATEVGLDETIARRAGLLHDIGKSIDREIEGTHTEIGATLARRFGESDEVIDAIAHHHDLELAKTLYPVIVSAADAISAARPGARRESLESYLRRLENLEAIANSFPGVVSSYAIQAGREIRIIVEPEKVDDSSAVILARDVANRIEQDMEYPGEVQVTVVRESRAVEYAR